MTDGAHLGVTADRAIQTILGGADQPTDDERLDPEAFRAMVLSAPTAAEFEASLDGKVDYTDDDYGMCATVAARAILEAFLADPALAAMPTETVYDWDRDPDHGRMGMKPEFVVNRGLSAELRDRAVRLPVGMSGFQWGWAVNAARFCVELPPAPNPAVITVEVPPLKGSL
jgi:hypothetical protein